VPANLGNVVDGAVSTTQIGCEQLFVGRAPFQGSLTVGKIHPSHCVLYIPFNGVEVSFSCYEVLVHTRGRSKGGKNKSKGKKEKKVKKKKRSKSSSSSSSSSSTSSSD
jgi:Protein of unknown function (DUF3421)